MKKAYIVLAHNKPEQLGRLVRSLDDGRAAFYVHLDRTCDQAPFRRELAGCAAGRFVKSEKAGWGESGLVRATLNGLKAVAESGESYGTVSLLSGQDYPLRSNAYIHRFFEVNLGKSFMEYFPLPTTNWSEEGLNRIHAYHVGDRRRRSRQKASRWLTTLCNASVVLRRRFPRGLKAFGGPVWWSLSMEAVDEILRFARRRPDVLRYHRWSMSSDEIYFQTVLANAGSRHLAENLVNNCLRFVDWHHPNPAAPATLTEEYFDAMIASKALFARKFDADRDAVILDRLDAYRADEEKRLREQFTAGLVTMDFSRSADYPESPASWSRPTFARPA